MKKPLIILGPTSSGKTALSFALARRIGDTDILVVDSKQVYRMQDIVTGKDLDASSTARLYGINLVNPDEEWSVAQFLDYAMEVVRRAEKDHRQLIIVGGTPQYTLSLFNQPESANVPPNETLRKELEHLSVIELQAKVNTVKLSSMNDSDRWNPRRLIRAIEIQSSPNTAHRVESLLKKGDVRWIGLELSKEKLEERIRRRVIHRLENGALEEYKYLSETYPRWRSEAKAAIGYLELEQFDSERIGREELINLWTLHEVQYAKRQMQWWKREDQIEWFDALDPSLEELVFARL